MDSLEREKRNLIEQLQDWFKGRDWELNYLNTKIDFLETYQDFEVRHRHDFDQFPQLFKTITEALSHLGHAQNFKNNYQGFQPLEVEDMDWYKNSQAMTNQSLQAQFLVALEEEYGFDDRTASLIYELHTSLEAKFPDMSERERDYLFMLLLGEFNYPGFRWDNTAGSLYPYFYKLVSSTDQEHKMTKVPISLEEIFKELGFSLQDYEYLRFILQYQHDFAGEVLADYITLNESTERYNSAKMYFEEIYGSLTHQEFQVLWTDMRNRFKNKTDFTHQYITMATLLYERHGNNLNKNFRLANVVGGSRKVDQLSGWRGDATMDAFTDPSMGNDDYHADLDAANIVNLMRNSNLTYVEASNQYYQDLKENKYTRVSQFLEIYNLPYIKHTIFESLRPENHIVISNNMDYLKENYPDSYNFIRSLEEDLNDMKDYSGE